MQLAVCSESLRLCRMQVGLLHIMVDEPDVGQTERWQTTLWACTCGLPCLQRATFSSDSVRSAPAQSSAVRRFDLLHMMVTGRGHGSRGGRPHRGRCSSVKSRSRQTLNTNLKRTGSSTEL